MNISIAETMELPKPSHWPESMARFGKTPAGDNRYRVVFAPTVRHLVFGKFPDGYVGARARRSYPAIGAKWILEKWISAYDATRMTASEYERYGARDPQSGLLITGPYPHSGMYQECHTFESGNPEPGSIEKVIALIELGATRSPGEVIANNRALDEKDAKAEAEQRFLRVREREPLYGIRPASFAGTPKATNHKSQRTPISANETGLPTSRGKFVAGRGPIVHASI